MLFFGFVNSIFSSDDVKTALMKEGTIPFLSLLPLPYNVDGVLPILWLSHSGDLKRRVKPHDQKCISEKICLMNSLLQLRSAFVKP
jgi:hypothetical protein